LSKILKLPLNEVSSCKLINELQRENHKLKRQISKLQSRVRKTTDLVQVQMNEDELIAEEKVPVCSNCGSSKIKETKIGVLTILNCASCKKNSRI
jgi:ribosomal protein L37AE/L43A